MSRLTFDDEDGDVYEDLMEVKKGGKSRVDPLAQEPPSEQPTEPVKSLLSKTMDLYKMLETMHPHVANALTTAAISGSGALLGQILARRSNFPSNSTPSSRQRQFDWLEVLAFAVYGGVIGGPMGHFWKRWMREHGPESDTNAMLFDQIIAQPPRLFFMAVFLDMTRAAIKEIPHAWHTSWNRFTPASVADSFSFWPLVTYLITRVLKKREHHSLALKVCALFWASLLAKRRSRIQKQT